MHKFSIVTPSYNQGQFLEQTIKSVLKQESVDLEYFVMDGGSTDNSSEIIDRYANKLAGWRSAPDSGQAWAINRGLEQSSGDIVAYINSDDYYPCEVFKRVSDIFRDENINWVAGIVEFVDGNSKHIMMQHPRPRDSLIESLVWGVDIGQPGVFFRRSLLEEVGFFDDSLSFIFDTEYWIRLIKAGHLPVSVPEVLAVRRLHGQTKTELLPKKFDDERELVRARYQEDLSQTEQKVLQQHLRQKAVHDHISLAADRFRSGRPDMAMRDVVRALITAPALSVRNIFSRLSHRLTRH